MRKRNRLSMVTMFGLLLAVVCLISVSGTYAKYTSELTGSDTAKVAKWNWVIGDAELKAGETVFTLSLFDTVKGYGTGDETTADDADVVDSKIIAPGTSGEFTVNVKNDSDVNATYDVSFELTSELTTVPNLQFSTDGKTWGELSSLNETATALTAGSETEIKVYWMWDYDAADDTEIGIAAANNLDARSLTVKATLTATQTN